MDYRRGLDLSQCKVIETQALEIFARVSDRPAHSLALRRANEQIQLVQTRRHFAKSIAAAAAALPFAGANAAVGTRRSAAKSASSKPIDVLIIGAGLSGLKSALLLEE